MTFDLEKALAHRIVLLAGDEQVLRRRALDELIQAASGGDDFDIEFFFADASSPAQWLGSCGTAPFLSPRRVAVVRNLMRSEAWEELGRPELPESALLVLVADGESSDESKQRAASRQLKAWEKAAKDAKGFLYRPSIDAGAFGELVKQELAGRNLKIGGPAVTLLQEMVAGNLSIALEELEKVALYVEGRPHVTEADLRAVVLPAREWSVFKLIDAIFGGQGGEALRQLKVMVGSNPKPESAALGQIMPMLWRQLRLVWQARVVLDHRARLTSLPEEVSRQIPSTHSLLAQKEYPQRLAMTAAQRVTLEQLSRCFELLAETESRLKGLEPLFTTTEALDSLVLQMTEVVRPRVHAGAR